MSVYGFLIISIVAYITLVGDFTHISFLYLLTVTGILLQKCKDTCILHLCFGLLCFKSIELLALSTIPTRASMGYDIAHVWLNTNSFLIHLAFDIGVLFFLFYRPALSRHYLRWLVVPKGKTHSDDELTYTKAEEYLIGIMYLYFIVDLAALAENLIRNLEYLGVDNSIAQYFWEWTLVYDLYTPVKNFLNLLELIAIWLVATPRGGKRVGKPKSLPGFLAKAS